jgi:hypothetical protein
VNAGFGNTSTGFGIHWLWHPLALATHPLTLYHRRYYYNGETQESVWEKPQDLKDWEVEQIRLHDPRTSMILAGLQGSGKVEIIEKKKDDEPKFFTPAFLNLGGDAAKAQMDAQKAMAEKAAAAVVAKKSLGPVTAFDNWSL